MWSDFARLHSLLSTHLSLTHNEVEERQTISDEMILLDVLYRVEREERVNSLDTLEQLATHLLACSEKVSE